MELENLKEKLQDLFEANKIKESLLLLKQELSRNSGKYSIFILIMRRFNDIQDQKMANTIDSNSYNIEANKIGGAFLNFIGTLDETDLETMNHFVHKKVGNQIAVFTENESSEKVEDFFHQLNFRNVSVFRANNFDNVEYTNFDLLIFDNRDLPPCFSKNKLDEFEDAIKARILGRIEKMDSVIRDSSKFLIHYGDFLFWINSNRERVQAANSQFSLYSRTKEVIEFINTYRV